jgi:hypothetical protein
MASFLPVIKEYFGIPVVLLWFAPYFHFIKFFTPLIRIESVRQEIRKLLENRLSPSLTYHNVQHTLAVVESCLEIAIYEEIIETESLLILETSAWLNDTGFTLSYANHEYFSCEIAKELLPGWDASEQEIERICSLIMGTKLPQSPVNLLGNILCDADLDYLGTNDCPLSTICISITDASSSKLCLGESRNRSVDLSNKTFSSSRMIS